MSEFGEVRQRRKQFLWAAYDLGKSRPASMVGMDEIARELGMELEPGLINAELIEYATYWVGKGFLKSQVDGYGILSITHEGIDEVEGDTQPQPVRVAMPTTPDQFSDSTAVGETPVEIQESIRRFRRDYPDPANVAFIMMQFGTTPAHERITNAIKEELVQHDITGVRADDRRYHDDLFYNVLTYMHGCGMGMAVYERLEANATNPNVALEVGYLFAMRKPVCLLKDQTLTTLQADLVGRLYDPFDPQNPDGTIQPVVRKWLFDKGLPES